MSGQIKVKRIKNINLQIQAQIRFDSIPKRHPQKMPLLQYQTQINVLTKKPSTRQSHQHYELFLLPGRTHFYSCVRPVCVWRSMFGKPVSKEYVPKWYTGESCSLMGPAVQVDDIRRVQTAKRQHYLAFICAIYPAADTPVTV